MKLWIQKIRMNKYIKIHNKYQNMKLILKHNNYKMP